MNQKTKRIALKAVKAFVVVALGTVAFSAYMIASVRFSVWLTGDTTGALLAIIVPLLTATCYFWARDRVNFELEKEESTLQALSRKYE